MSEVSTECVNCRSSFKECHKGFARKSLKILASPGTIHSSFSGKVLSPEEYKTKSLCPNCKSTLISQTKPKRKSSNKRTYVSAKVSAAPKHPKRSRTDYKETAKKFIDDSKYVKAFRCLMPGSQKAGKALRRVCARQVQKEVSPVIFVCMDIFVYIYICPITVG